MLITRI